MYMYGVFTKFLNMSFLAGSLVLAVLLLRIVLKKAPKRIVCFLWVLVAFRLICPFSISSSLSVFNLFNTGAGSSSKMEYFQYDETYLPAVMFIWGLGVLGMIAYALVSYVNLKRKVSASIKRNDNVYICDEIKSSFIFGVIRPRIYLPSGIEESVENYVIAHEKAHLKRHDYLWKPLGFLLLAVYWFHPILWLAYVLFCRDIEAACDEKVIEDLDKERKADYSAALLTCAMQRRMITVCPLAFGETNVKGRVKSILNYKKPAFRVVAVAIVLCIAAAICLLTNPQSDSNASSVGDEQVDFYLDVNQEDDNDAIDSTSELLHSENGREYGYPARTYTIGKDTEGVGEDSKE